MKIFILFSIFYFSPFMMVFSQNQNEKTDGNQTMTAFSDYRNSFFVFDNGVFTKVESHPVKDFKIGSRCIAYIDNSDNLKAYYLGSVYNLSMQKPKDYLTEGKMVVSLHDKVLSLFDDGKTIILSTAASNYSLQDSLLFFYDENESKFMIYQNGRTKNLEGTLVDNIISISDIRAGDNIIAYTFNSNSFKIYFRKQAIVMETSPAESYRVAKNIVAYVDGYSKLFKVFHNGLTEVLSEIKPKSYQAGEDIVAFVDLTGTFKIFYDGNTFEISTFEPEFYEVKDRLVIFFVNDFFQVFYKGTLQPLEKVIPSGYKSDMSTLAYIDDLGYLKVFGDGLLKQVSKADRFEVTGNLVTYWNMNEINIFSEGNTFTKY